MGLALVGCVPEEKEEKIYFHEGKEYHSSELSQATIEWFERGNAVCTLTGYNPPELNGK